LLFLHQVIKNSQADAVEELKGMADDVNHVTLALEKDEVLSLQVINESEITTIESVSMQEVSEEVISEDNVSIPRRKRKHSDKIEFDSNCVSNEVSLSQKRARTTTSCCDKSVPADHTYCIKSPRRMKSRLNDVVDKATILKKRLESSQKKLRRYREKVSTLTTVVSELKEQNLINNDCATILETTFSGISRELMKRLVTQKVKKNPGAYPPELRSFTMTLKFYSTKAYNYVRKSFDLGLPHVSVIRSWYSSMNGEPGFTKNALAALKVKVLAAKENHQELFVH
jgi:hypothetical protein